MHAGMMTETELSITPQPNVVILREVRNVKEWIQPSLEDLHGHSSPHCFRFIKDEAGDVRMFYKNWSSDPWCDEVDAVKLLKVTGYIMLVE